MARSRALALVAVCLGLAACSGETRVAATRPAGSAAVPATRASPSSAPLLVGTVAPPPVRLFAGVHSVAGTPVRYCVHGRCVGRRSTPPRLRVDAGSIVTFAAGRAPRSATLEVAGRRTPLTASILMAYPERLAPGPLRMTLALQWADAEGTWIFELAVRKT